MEAFKDKMMDELNIGKKLQKITPLTEKDHQSIVKLLAKVNGVNPRMRNKQVLDGLGRSEMFDKCLVLYISWTGLERWCRSFELKKELHRLKNIFYKK